MDAKKPTPLLIALARALSDLVRQHLADRNDVTAIGAPYGIERRDNRFHRGALN
jgi:hypothetical protein